MYRTRPVPVALGGAVRRIAAYDEVGAAPVRRREVPHAGCTLIVGFGAPLEVDGPAGRSRPRAFLAGVHDAPVTTTFTGRQRGVQVDLSPLAARRLLGIAPAELTRRVPALDVLGVPALAALPERLAEDPGWDVRLDRVVTVLRALAAASDVVPDPEVAWAWRRIRRSGGRVAVTRLADEVGWSRRHLLTRFHAQVGVSPTTAGRITRFERATALLLPGSGPSREPADVRIADVAAATGYADHAHLDREFRALAGCTPTAWLREQEFPDVQEPAASGS